MAETTEDKDRRLPWSIVAGRLRARRWSIAGAAAVAAVAMTAITAMAQAGSLSPLITVAIVLVVAAVIVMLPDAPRDAARREAQPSAPAEGLASLSARTLADAVPDPMLVFDADGIIVHANPEAHQTFGRLAPGTLLALRFRAPEIGELIGKLVAGGAGQAASEYAERVPIERWFKVVGRPVGTDGTLFALVFRDQSEIRRIDRMRSDFIANASHELRTPLASVSGFIETLRGPARNDAAAREKFLEIMQAQTARMARLIDDLLSLSRLEMKPYASPTERIDIVALLDGVIAALAHIAEETHVTVERQMPETPVMVRGNRDELIQVFENLIENACKYGQSGGRVVVAVQPPAPGQMSGASVSVTDFGPGIAEEHIPRITERFYRVDAGASRAQKGTGLGLAIVKHILTRHDARLAVVSDVGRGATFTVHFPRS